jgi:PAS domain S-box-containing protein
MPKSSQKDVSDAALLAAIVEFSADAIVTKDLNGVITSWNQAAEKVFGYTAAEAVGKSVTLLIPDDRIDEEPGILARIRRGESVEHYETVRKTKDGRLIDISLTVSPIRREDGVVVGASKVARDVSDRRRAEAELTHMASIVESSNDAIISKDLNGIIQTWNQGAQAIFGYTAEEAIGQPVTMLIPEERIDEEPGILSRIRRGEAVDHYETIRKRKDGSLINISLNVSPVRDTHGVIIGASKIARDVTERNRFESARRDAEIMNKLLETQEAERRRIARDLHDHIGQYMTAMRLTLSGLVDSASDPAHKEELLKVKKIAERIDRDLSFLTWELRPTELEMLGLKDALESFTKEWSDHCGVPAEFHFVGDEGTSRLSAQLETNLYRITQEALNNVAKHAGATRVSILMHWQRSQIFMIIEDNGKGFDASAQPAEGHGRGLLGMRERVHLLNGKLSVESSAENGTTIIVTVPVVTAGE